MASEALCAMDKPAQVLPSDAAYPFVIAANRKERALRERYERRLVAMPRLPSPWHAIYSLSSGAIAGTYVMIRMTYSEKLAIFDLAVIGLWVFLVGRLLRFLAKRWPA